MNEMIERVARAIAADNENWPYDRRPWSEQRYLLERARAAIEAMREPTEAMKAAAKPFRKGVGEEPGGLWHAMIDAALQD
jgi:hypothetical protein